MSFLKFNPTVYVVNDEYELVVCTNDNGLCSVRIGDEIFYEENSGVLASEKNYFKIRLPQGVLNAAKAYEIRFRKTVLRKAYFSQFEETQTARFSFRPLEKTTDIKMYHIADVHYRFELAKKTASYFGDELDVLILNGDIGEVEKMDDFFAVAQFVGDVAKGEIPVIFVRGNHDTRGHLAELYTEFFPSNGKKTYYTAQVGNLCAVVVDCGEDKPDNHPEYGGMNVFERYRREETKFLKALPPQTGKTVFAISHVCPSQVTLTKGSPYDIERDVYTEWTDELGRLDTKFMLCGHIHKAYVLQPNDPASMLPHPYPVVVGSACFGNDDLWGTAIVIRKGGMDAYFTDASHTVREKHSFEF